MQRQKNSETEAENTQSLSDQFQFSSPTTEQLENNQRNIDAEKKRTAELEKIKRRQWSESQLKIANLPNRHSKKIELTGEKWKRIENGMGKKLGDGYIAMFAGGRGVGKTQMAVQLVKHAIENQKTGMYTNAMDFFLDVRASFKDTKLTEKSIIAQYVKPQLLVIDAMEERGESEWEDRLLNNVIDRRYGANHDTVLIGNFQPNEFKEAIGLSIASRAEECGGVIEFDWKSYRGK